MPAALPGSFGARPAVDTPCSEWSSGASTASIASAVRSCGRTGGMDIDMRDTPACKTAPGQQPLTTLPGTAGESPCITTWPYPEHALAESSEVD